MKQFTPGPILLVPALQLGKSGTSQQTRCDGSRQRSLDRRVPGSLEGLLGAAIPMAAAGGAGALAGPPGRKAMKPQRRVRGVPAESGSGIPTPSSRTTLPPISFVTAASNYCVPPGAAVVVPREPRDRCHKIRHEAASIDQLRGTGGSRYGFARSAIWSPREAFFDGKQI